MTLWRVLILGFVLLWIAMAVVSFRLRRARVQEEQRLEDAIRPPVYREEFRKADESLQVAADVRRHEAGKRTREAARIASGAEPEKRIRRFG